MGWCWKRCSNSSHYEHSMLIVLPVTGVQCPNCFLLVTLVRLLLSMSIHLYTLAMTKHCNCTVLMVFCKFLHPIHQPIKTESPDTLLLLMYVITQSSHVGTFSGERRPNVEGQICHYSKREVPWLLLHVHSALGTITKKENGGYLLIYTHIYPTWTVVWIVVGPLFQSAPQPEWRDTSKDNMYRIVHKCWILQH